jgi:hypothetical protein
MAERDYSLPHDIHTDSVTHPVSQRMLVALFPRVKGAKREAIHSFGTISETTNAQNFTFLPPYLRLPLHSEKMEGQNMTGNESLQSFLQIYEKATGQ